MARFAASVNGRTGEEDRQRGGRKTWADGEWEGSEWGRGEEWNETAPAPTLMGVGEQEREG